jgi:hypothetical protein
LQPLIGNLIARLKGLPVQEGEQSGSGLEDDLVVLLQSLMAHRQAQQDLQAQQQLNSSIAAFQDSTANAAINDSITNTVSVPTHNADSLLDQQIFQAQPGFSIVDFDFGDDDDDPDFVPKNVALDFAASAEFADALAHVSTAPLPSMMQERPGELKTNSQQEEVQVSHAAWQQVVDSIGQVDNSMDKIAGGNMPVSSPASRNGFRRTRSTTRNFEMEDEGEGTQRHLARIEMKA